MSILILLLGVPLFGALAMMLIGAKRFAGAMNFGLCATNLAVSVFLAFVFSEHNLWLNLNQQFYLDAFNLSLIVLTTFVTTTTAWFSLGYMRNNLLSRKITSKLLQLYHVMYQFFALTILLALTTNNLGILWVAIEGATLATVLLVSLYRTPEAIEAAWKYFILCIMAIALALFGIILIYFAAEPIGSMAKTAIFWSVLVKNAHLLNPGIIKLAFVFLLVGYGSKIGFVPLHNWLPDTYSESPAPVSALLSALLSTVALYSLIRFKIIVDLSLGTNLAGNMLMGFGLLSFITAAVLMHRQQNIKRLFAYSSIEHLGLIAFAFGLGGKFATYCALFYMLVHALAKSAIFVTVGNVVQFAGTHSLDKIRGIIKSQPLIGWGLLIATLVIAGAPPFGIFTNELLVFIATLKKLFWVAIILLIGFISVFAALLGKIQPVVYGEALEGKKIRQNMTSAFLHLGLVLIFGLYMPNIMHSFLLQAAIIICGN